MDDFVDQQLNLDKDEKDGKEKKDSKTKDSKTRETSKDSSDGNDDKGKKVAGKPSRDKKRVGPYLHRPMKTWFKSDKI